MYKILGIDNGNEVVKTNKGIKFFNRMNVGKIRLNKDDIIINYNNLDYTVGVENAPANVGENKHLKTHYKTSILTSIALSVPDENDIKAKIVVGAPVEDHNKEEYTKSIKDTIMSWKMEKINVNGVEKTIEILDCEVFPESGIPFSNKSKYKEQRTLVIDIGGSTVDVSLWNGLRLEEFQTYKEGMLSLYSNIIKIINNENSTKLNSIESKYMIGKDFYNINQKKVEIKPIVDSIIEVYLNGIFSKIYQDFEREKVTSVEVIGGGAIALRDYIGSEYKTSPIANDADFANAKAFAKVGEAIWE